MYSIEQFKELPAPIRQRVLDQYVELRANEYLFQQEYVNTDFPPTVETPNRFALDKEWSRGSLHYFDYEEHLKAHIEVSAQEQLIGDTYVNGNG